MSSSITIKNEEAKTITFSISRSGSAVDLSAVDALDFVVKQDYEDDTPIISKTTADFNTAQASVGIISVILATDDLDYDNIENGIYLSELRITFISGTDVDISANIPFTVERSLYR